MKFKLLFILLYFGNNLFGQCSTCSSIEEAMKEPERVEVLKLQNYSLKKFPEKINLFHNLNELDLSNYEDYMNDGTANVINSISSKISSLKNLKILKLNNVDLRSIPVEIGSLENLEILHLGNNENLTKIPNEVGKLTNIKELHLHNIDLDSIPNWIGELENLEVLYLDGNNISHLPSTLVKLKKLRVLGLSGNKLGTKLTKPSFKVGDQVIDTTNGSDGTIIEINEHSLIVEGWTDNDPFNDTKFEIKKGFANWAIDEPCPIELEVLYEMNWKNIETLDLQSNDPKINNYLNGVSNSLEEHILMQRNPNLFTLQLFLPYSE